MRVLIIDDDPHVTRLASFALRARGVDVAAATVSSEGLRLARTEKFDALLLDLVMPELDGRALLSALRADESTRQLPVIFFTARNAPADVESLRALAVCGVIAKPFDPARLTAEVFAILGLADSPQAEAEIPHEMRRAFLLSCSERLDALERALDAMQRRPDDADHLRAFSAECHRLAGAAASYGFTPVSDAAAHAEAECDGIIRADAAPAAEALHRWRDLLREMRGHLAAAGADAAPAANARRIVRLLCVDRDAATGESLRLLDADSGFAVEFAAGGEPREDVVPDLLIAGRDATDAVDRLRAMPQGRRAGVIMVTGDQPADADLSRALSLGVDALVTDPADSAAFIGRIRAVVDRRFGAPPRLLCLGLDRYAHSFASVLESAGYVVRIAAAAAQFNVDLDTFEPDLILAGIGEDADAALELPRAVRLRPDALVVPVVLIAGEQTGDIALQAARAGAVELLRLPISRGLLLATIENRVDAARAYKFAMRCDPLTGCWRDSYFRERLQRRLAGAAPGSQIVLAVLETAGGDGVVLSLADLLRRRLRETDEIARCGEDRFAVLMERITEDNAAALFRRLQEEFAAACAASFRTGVVAWGGHRSAESWMRTASDALNVQQRTARAYELRPARAGLTFASAPAVDPHL
jgi:DNA-binding response OmpR family regulator